MGLITYLILLALIGLVVGALARLLLPGPDPMSIPATIGVGLLGSFAAGLVARLLFDATAGFILAVLVTMLFVWLFRDRGRVVTR